MRIAFLCRSFPFHRQGGMEWHAWDLVRGLVARGHELRIVTTPFDPPDKKSPLRRQTPDKGIDWHLVGEPRAGGYSLSYFTGAAELAVDWARSGEIDLVHAQGFGGLFLNPVKLDEIPLLTTIHGTWWSETLLGRRARRTLTGARQAALLWRYRRRALLTPFWKRFLRSAPLLLVDSEFTRCELLREHPDLESRIHLVPLGIDLERFPLVEDEKPPHEGETNPPAQLLAIGRLEPAKGFSIAIEALARCRSRSWVLRLGGEGPDRSRLEALASRHGLLALPDQRDRRPLPRVEFLGRVPDDRLPREFAQADLFLNPDLTEPAFGLVALEAMLQATPVLASDAGAMPEVLGPVGGWLAPPGDINAWSRTLDSLLSGSDCLALQGREARRSALQRFSLDRMLNALEAAYHRQVTSRPRATI